MGFMNEHGLLNPTSRDIVSENCFLTSLTYQNVSKTIDDDLLKSMYVWVSKCRVEAGKYHQHPLPFYNNHDDYTSPDQLLAFILFFYQENQIDECKAIWKYLVRHLFTYDNLTWKINFKRIMQPQVIFLAGYCAGHKWMKYFLYQSMVHSCKKERMITSGKQKAFNICKCLNLEEEFSKLNGMCWFWDALAIYYGEEDHPIRIILKRDYHTI